MMCKFAKSIAMFAVLTPLPLLTGCGSGETAELPTTASVEVPQDFSDGNTTWRHVEAMEEADTDCLARFFKNRIDLQGSPDLEGEPRLFRAEKSDRRFYWMNPTAQGDVWKCVSFERGKYSFSEGDGNPFGA